MKAWFTIILTGVLAASAWSQPLSKLIVFGDSLSDTGNSYEYSNHRIPSGAVYYQGRFSNGPIWVDRSIDVLFPKTKAQSVLNYAFGGAGVLNTQGESFTLSQEIDSYLLSHQSRLDAETALVLWIGANDYLVHPAANEADIEAVITAIEASLQRLVDHGAHRVLVVGLPNLGESPFARELDAVDQLSKITQTHNQLLKEMVVKLQTQYRDLDWVYLDVDRLFVDLKAHPEQYGLTHIEEKCLHLRPQQQGLAVMQAEDQGQCLGYLFFDQLHPTTAVHQLLAHAVVQVLDRWNVRDRDLS
ncbi:MAG: SGNH/GDSL hydrolase family protein [Gammaproteobacteria bacterium]|nr:SGNH/GDSL hydrolase family protein [Gammaproteobacteria bacterium]